LTTFFNGYMGLSPKDFGALGNGQVDSTCTGTTTVTCTDAPFVAGDVGKIYESSSCGSTCVFPPTVITGTIQTFISSTQVTVNNSIATASNQFKWYTLDTTAMDSWKSSVNAVGSVHSGYLPKGVYFTAHPMSFIGPANKDCNYGSIAGVASGTLACSLIIVGAGNTVSVIEIPTAGAATPFNWAFNGATANAAPVYCEGWASFRFQDFGIAADGTAQATSGTTGLTGGLEIDACQHGYVANVAVQGFHNAGNNLAGYNIGCGNTTTLVTSLQPGAFESWIQPYSEGNDANLQIANATVNCTFEKETYANGFLEGGLNANLKIGNASGSVTSTLKQIRFENLHLLLPSGAIASSASNVQFGAAANAITTLNKDSVVFDKVRMNCSTNQPTNPCFIISASTGGVGIDWSNGYAEELGTSTNPIFSITSGANANLRITGGSLNNASSCTTGCIIANNDASSFVWISNATTYPLNSTDTFRYSGAGVANISTLENYTTPYVGSGGRGALTASNYLTSTKCAANGTAASPSIVACAAASSGVFSCGVGAETVCTVNTTAMTNAGSTVIVTQDSSTTTGTLLGVTCNVTVNAPEVTAKVAATSFSITITAPAVNPACYQYHIMN
jgi:hypothetical protein